MHRFMTHCRTLAACAALALLPTAAAAQRAIELGVDGALSRTRLALPPGSAPDWRTELELPVSNFRIGFLDARRRWSVEPNLAATLFSAGGIAATYAQIDVGLLYHLAAASPRAPGRPQPYLRPFLGIEHDRVSGVGSGGTETHSDLRARMGMGLGVKLPMVDRLATRLEARYVHVTRGDDPDIPHLADAVALAFGLSFFTR